MQEKVVRRHNGGPSIPTTTFPEDAMSSLMNRPLARDLEISRLRALLAGAGIDPDAAPSDGGTAERSDARPRGEAARATGRYRLALSLGQPRLQPSGADIDRIEAVLQSAVDFAIIATDLAGAITIWNEGAARILGWSAEDVEDRPGSLIFTPEDRAAGAPEAEMKEALARGRADDERWHLRKDGSRFFASGTMMPLRTEGGSTVGFLKILRDETERRLAEDQLRESEAFTRSILAASRDCIKVLDSDGFVAVINDNGLALLEAPSMEALRGTRWVDFWGGDRDLALEAIGDAAAGRTGRFQARAPTLAGSLRWWDVMVTQIPATGASPARILVVSRDITQSKEAALRMADSARRMKTVLDTIPIGVLLADRTGHVMEGNGRATEILKHAPARDTDERWHGFHEDGTVVDRADYPLRRVLDGGEARATLEVDYQRGDGTRAWVSFEAAPIHGGEGGEITGAVVAISDIDARKKAEARQRFLMGELSHRVKNILAVVVSIARQTLRNAPTLEEASETLLSRINALAGAHDVLMQHHWASADLAVLIAGAMKIHDNDGKQVSIAGPDVRLGPQAALSIALVIHELGTNAVKYGALADPAGRLAITWQVEARSGEPDLVFRWQESVTTPVVPPERSGFGSRLIKHSLSSFGTVTVNYATEGLSLTFEAPLARIQQAK